jgi:chaperone modulatory protein CbpM
MSEKKLMKEIIIENTRYSFMEVCQRFQLSEDVVREWLDHGLLGEEYDFTDDTADFNRQMLDRLDKALRLNRDLEVNLPGVVLVLELLDEMSALENELQILKRFRENWSLDKPQSNTSP